jgi:hypothetical protein
VSVTGGPGPLKEGPYLNKKQATLLGCDGIVVRDGNRVNGGHLGGDAARDFHDFFGNRHGILRGGDGLFGSTEPVLELTGLVGKAPGFRYGNENLPKKPLILDIKEKNLFLLVP